MRVRAGKGLGKQEDPGHGHGLSGLPPRFPGQSPPGAQPQAQGTCRCWCERDGLSQLEDKSLLILFFGGGVGLGQR